MEPLTITISLPSSVRPFIDQELSEGNFHSPEELVASLVNKAAQKKHVFEKIETLLWEAESKSEFFDWNSQAFQELNAGVREVRKKRAEQTLTKLVEEAIASGEPTPFTKQDWEQIRCRVKERIAAPNHGKRP